MEAPEKLYLNWTEYPLNEIQVEYTRTDAFIEKAVDYIANNMQCNGYTIQTKVKFIRDFKKYMED